MSMPFVTNCTQIIALKSYLQHLLMFFQTNICIFLANAKGSVDCLVMPVFLLLTSLHTVYFYLLAYGSDTQRTNIALMREFKAIIVGYFSTRISSFWHTKVSMENHCGLWKTFVRQTAVG